MGHRDPATEQRKTCCLIYRVTVNAVFTGRLRNSGLVKDLQGLYGLDRQKSR